CDSATARTACPRLEPAPSSPPQPHSPLRHQHSKSQTCMHTRAAVPAKNARQPAPAPPTAPARPVRRPPAPPNAKLCTGTKTRHNGQENAQDAPAAHGSTREQHRDTHHTATTPQSDRRPPGQNPAGAPVDTCPCCRSASKHLHLFSLVSSTALCPCYCFLSVSAAPVLSQSSDSNFCLRTLGIFFQNFCQTL
ncbi:hypothetical protein PAPHI01_2373, partial [Pancytospora philotis]